MGHLILMIAIVGAVSGTTCDHRIALIGEDVLIQCSYTELPVYITWKFLDSFIITHLLSLVDRTENKGKYISEIKRDSSRFTLKIQNVSFGDAGNYQSAQYFATKTTKVDQSTLQVQGYPKLSKEPPVSNESDTVSASCCLKIGYLSGPVSFLWILKNDLLEDRFSYGREAGEGHIKDVCNNITYQSLRRHNGQTLTCLVSNENNVNVSTTLHVFYRPSVVLINPNWPTFLNEGDNVSIQCETDGNPSPSVKLQMKAHNQDWTTLQLESISLYSVETAARWRFVIPDVNSCMMGNYRCMASNDFGSVETKSEVQLNVYEQAKVSILNTSTSVHEHDFINILCRTSGNPLPVVKLQKISSNGVWETLPNTPEQLLHNATKRFTISRFKYGYLSKWMVGVFRCIAFNGFGLNASSSEISLNVLYPSSVSIKSVSIAERGDVHILCEADGNPSPNVSLEWKTVDGYWTKVPVIPMIHSLGHNQTIWRFDFNITERGYCRCIAFNGVGTVSRSREMVLEIRYSADYDFGEVTTRIIPTEDQQRESYLLCEIDKISENEHITLQEKSPDGHWISLPVKPITKTTLNGNTSWLFRTENIGADSEKTYRCFVESVTTSTQAEREDFSITTDYYKTFSPVVVTIGTFLVVAIGIVSFTTGKYCRSVSSTRKNREKEILDTDYMQRADDIYDFEVWRSHDPSDGTEV